MLLAVLILLINFGLWIFIKFIKLIIALIIIAIYGVSPIDLLPDVFIGVGWIDDFLVTIGGLYWGLTLGRLTISLQLKHLASEINSRTKIKTAFP